MNSGIMTIRTSDGRAIGVPVILVNTLIIGAGAGALKCAQMLHTLGVRDMAIVVDRLGNGTSNNSGSDKQTYYKLGIFGDDPDSPMEFARTLFAGGMMHGDHAYIEGLLSAPAFFDLCRIGVPFPFNRYGAYVGYKTDHDPRQRATSAGPKTSMMMFGCLLEEVRRQGTPILDRHEAVRLLVADEAQPPEASGLSSPRAGRRVMGAVCVNRGECWRESFGITVFGASNVVLGTGGPGELYEISVWPHGQLGSHGLAFEAGAAGNNLTELQFGLASTAFRWNLSGTYQQVIPDYFSTSADGVSDRRPFLHATFSDMGTMALNVFLKGYQWPFHAARLQGAGGSGSVGSSAIDMAVHREISSGRRVFLDFTHNLTPAPGMRPFSIARLPEEARRYLERSGATQATPLERLRHMNPQSIELYAEHGIDLAKPLEAAVCAQHCNGGLAVDSWWETTVRHLFAVGELAGTHGVRPGGSALNSGQVGAMRAARLISSCYRDPPPAMLDLARACPEQIEGVHSSFASWLGNTDPRAVSLAEVRPAIQRRMSREGAFIRSLEGARKALGEARELYRQMQLHGFRCDNPKQLVRATEDRMLALTSIAFLKAIVSYIESGGGSRGGYMVLDPRGDRELPGPDGSSMRYRSENVAKRAEILELRWDGETDFTVRPCPVRPLPRDESWFETVWAQFCRGEVVRPD